MMQTVAAIAGVKRKPVARRIEGGRYLLIALCVLVIAVMLFPIVVTFLSSI